MTQTKIKEYLWVGDHAGYLSGDVPHVVIDLRSWLFDVKPMRKNDHKFILGVIYSINEARQYGLPILIKCHGGIDRSPFVTACYIGRFSHLQYHEAYQLVKEKHNPTFIHSDWMDWFIMNL